MTKEIRNHHMRWALTLNAAIGSVSVVFAFLALTGCQLFWNVPETHPDVKGTWQGQVLAVTLYDGAGQAYPVPIAGLKLVAGTPWEDWHPNPSYPQQPRPIVVLSRDGHHALALKDFNLGAWIEVSGTVRYNDLKAPDSDLWLDDMPKPKHLTPSDRTDAVRFLKLAESVRPIQSPPGTRP